MPWRLKLFFQISEGVKIDMLPTTKLFPSNLSSGAYRIKQLLYEMTLVCIYCRIKVASVFHFMGSIEVYFKITGVKANYLAWRKQNNSDLCSDIILFRKFASFNLI